MGTVRGIRYIYEEAREMPRSGWRDQMPAHCKGSGVGQDGFAANSENDSRT